MPTQGPTTGIKSILTTKEKIFIASAISKDWLTSNAYVGIGHVPNWPNNDGNIPSIDNSTDSLNDVFNNLVSLKKIEGGDLCLVIPRSDWANNTVYGYYANNVDMFSTQILTSNVGTVSVTEGSSILTGTSTDFAAFFNIGDTIQTVNTAVNYTDTKIVVSIANNTSLNVNTAYSYSYNADEYYKVEDTFPYYSQNFYIRNIHDQVFKCLYNANNSMSTVMPQITLGGQLPTNPFILTSDGYYWKYMYTIPGGLKEKFFNESWMPVWTDSAVTQSAVPGRIDFVNIVSGGSGYNNSVASNNANILTITGDGSGASAIAIVDGNGTIIGLNLTGGRGYTYANVVISGSGTGANLIPIISPEGGNGSNSYYELGATNIMLCTELDSIVGGTFPVANTDVGISTIQDFQNTLYIPAGKTNPFTYHQISVIKNPILGSVIIPSCNLISGNSVVNTTSSLASVNTNVLISGFGIPPDTYIYSITTGVSGNNQIKLSQPAACTAINILLNAQVANNQIASGPNYRAAIGVKTQQPSPGTLYMMDDVVYQGSSSSPTFAGSVVTWDNSNNIVYLNNVKGLNSFNSSAILYSSSAQALVIELIPPSVQTYTGDILYVENRSEITRVLDQTEQIKLVIEL